MLTEQGLIRSETEFAKEGRVRWATMKVVSGQPDAMEFGNEELDRGEDSYTTLPQFLRPAERSFRYPLAALNSIDFRKIKGECLANLGLAFQVGAVGKVIIDVIHAKQADKEMSWSDYVASLSLQAIGVALVMKGSYEHQQSEIDMNLYGDLFKKYYTGHH